MTRWLSRLLHEWILSAHRKFIVISSHMSLDYLINTLDSLPRQSCMQIPLPSSLIISLTKDVVLFMAKGVTEGVDEVVMVIDFLPFTFLPTVPHAKYVLNQATLPLPVTTVLNKVINLLPHHLYLLTLPLPLPMLKTQTPRLIIMGTLTLLLHITSLMIFLIFLSIPQNVQVMNEFVQETAIHFPSITLATPLYPLPLAIFFSLNFIMFYLFLKIQFLSKNFVMIILYFLNFILPFSV